MNLDDFRQHIYNDAYKLVDPDSHPRGRARMLVVARLWGAIKTDLRVLDYGGGNDTFCAVLREAGFPVAVTFDPLVPEYAVPPEGKFDLVTSFETIEHMPDPAAGIEAIVKFVAEPGLIFFTTLLQPADIDKQRLGWWYAGPRNGHVSLFSREALRRAWSPHGYKVLTFSDNAHLAFRTVPPGRSCAGRRCWRGCGRRSAQQTVTSRFRILFSPIKTRNSAAPSAAFRPARR